MTALYRFTCDSCGAEFDMRKDNPNITDGFTAIVYSIFNNKREELAINVLTSKKGDFCPDCTKRLLQGAIDYDYNLH